jgi:16S rRNA (guanine527-N7)-methyltransferase
MADVNHAIAVFHSALLAATASWSMKLSPVQLELLRTHYEMLVEANRRVNLTRITDPCEAAVKHYADSLALVPWVARESLRIGTVLDIGTGGGFPAVPLAVACPDWRITAIDAKAKKTSFIDRFINTVGLRNLAVIHAHTRHWSSPLRFDLVVFRAVSRLGSCLEEAVRFTKPGGFVVAWRTAEQWAAEQEEVKTVAALLHLSVGKPFAYTLCLNGELLERVLATFQLKR